MRETISSLMGSKFIAGCWLDEHGLFYLSSGPMLPHKNGGCFYPWYVVHCPLYMYCYCSFLIFLLLYCVLASFLLAFPQFLWCRPLHTGMEFGKWFQVGEIYWWVSWPGLALIWGWWCFGKQSWHSGGCKSSDWFQWIPFCREGREWLLYCWSFWVCCLSSVFFGSDFLGTHCWEDLLCGVLHHLTYNCFKLFYSTTP